MKREHCQSATKRKLRLETLQRAPTKGINDSDRCAASTASLGGDRTVGLGHDALRVPVQASCV